MEIGKIKGKLVSIPEQHRNRWPKILKLRGIIQIGRNERSYPDIMNVIDLSNLYSLSLDDLLKGDDKMIEHLEENTNIVKNQSKADSRYHDQCFACDTPCGIQYVPAG